MATTQNESPTNGEQASNNHEHHHHHHEASHTDRNLAHWNQAAKDYNSTHTQKEFGDLINKTTEFILSNISAVGVDFLEPSSTFEDSPNRQTQRPVRVLDYACGPGTITGALAGRATEFVGIDLSPNMVQAYNDRFSSLDGEKINAEAYVANLFDENGLPEILNDPKFLNFDLVAVGLGFHHFQNLPTVTQRLVDRLQPGGVLMILDFFTHDKEDMAGHAAHKTVAHHGFSEAQIMRLFADAGLKDNQVIAYPDEILLRGIAKRKLFMARGRKPA